MGGKKKKAPAAGAAGAAVKGAGGNASGGGAKTAAGGAAAAGKGAADGKPTVGELFSKLAMHCKKSEFSKVVKTADEILSLSPGDEDALRCKVIGLIQAGNSAEGLKLLQSHDKLDMAFEKAYCLYRLNRLPEALAALPASGERTAGMLQLEGQVLYRMGDSGGCISRFEELMRRHRQEANLMEVKTNVMAAYVMGGRGAEVRALMEGQLRVAPRDGFDIAYNAACALIEAGDHKGAEEMLLLARRVGQEFLIDEELTTQEIEEELAPITVQLAYAQQVQGRRTDAHESYNAFLKRRPADAASVAVATCNLIALRAAKDVMDGLKRLEKMVTIKEGGGAGGGSKEEEGGDAMEVDGDGKGEGRVSPVTYLEGLETKLSVRQKHALLHNLFLLLLAANKLQEARTLLPALESLAPSPDSWLPLHAALLQAEAKGVGVMGATLGALLAAQSDGQKHAATAHLLSAQALASEGKLQEAAEALSRVEAMQHRPAVVATIVELRERAGDVVGAEAALDAAVKYWESHLETTQGDQPSAKELIIEAAAAFKKRHGKFQAAAEAFRKLRKVAVTPLSRSEALLGLIECTAEFDPMAAEKLALELPPLAGAATVDTAALERAAGTQPAISKAKRAAADEDGGAGEKQQQQLQRAKKRRKRKIIYPKGFDPANPGPPPDPERWLPKRERSSYKPRKKDKRKVDVRGAQGAVVREKVGDAVGGAAEGGGAGEGKGKGGAVGAKGGKKEAGGGGGKAEEAAGGGAAAAAATAAAKEGSAGGKKKSGKKGRR